MRTYLAVGLVFIGVALFVYAYSEPPEYSFGGGRFPTKRETRYQMSLGAALAAAGLALAISRREK